jgi:hypothetical protein
MWTNALAWLLGKLPEWVSNERFHIVKAKRSVLGIVAVSVVFVVFVGRLWASYTEADASLWRLSNYALRQRTIEFSSQLQNFAARQTTSLNASPNAGPEILMQFRAEYAKEFRATALELREVLESRVCGDYQFTRETKSSLDFEYDLGQSPYGVTSDLEGMANDLCWSRSVLPRLGAMLLP